MQIRSITHLECKKNQHNEALVILLTNYSEPQNEVRSMFDPSEVSGWDCDGYQSFV